MDRLKQINDCDGHNAGDQALKKVADAIRRSCRTTDLAARYGGDEFAVLAPNTTGDDGVALAERIRLALGGSSIGDDTLSVSIGVADVQDAPALEASAMCLAADRALYRAKAQGRDRVARVESMRKGEAPMDLKPQEKLRLKVSVRHVYSGDGKLSEEMRVYCPDQEHLVSVEDCTNCPRLSGIYLKPGERSSYLKCSPKKGTAAMARNGTDSDRISAVMTPSVVCVRPDLSVQAVVDIFLERQISGAPVVDETGKLVGIVSKTDLLSAKNRATDSDDPERLPETVDQIMMPFVFALHEGASVSQAAGLMAAEGVHRILVVSPRGELVGLLSALDVLRWLAERDGYLKVSTRTEEMPVLEQTGTAP